MIDAAITLLTGVLIYGLLFALCCFILWGITC